jgi:hypothetical protein
MNYNTLSLCAENNNFSSLTEKDHETLKNSKTIMHGFFLFACSEGRLDLAKWLYELSKTEGYNKIPINEPEESPFRSACDNNKLAVAKWLYKLSVTDKDYKRIDIHARDDEVFRITYDLQFYELHDWLNKIHWYEQNNDLEKFDVLEESEQSYSDNKFKIIIPCVICALGLFSFSFSYMF